MATGTQQLAVESTPDGITVYRLLNLSDLVFMQWSQQLDEHLSRLQKEKQFDAASGLSRRILHDLSVLETPDYRIMAHLRSGLRMYGNRGLKLRSAVVVQNAVTARLIKRLLGLPSHMEDDTLQIVSPSEVWVGNSLIGYFDDFDAAVAWLQSAG